MSFQSRPRHLITTLAIAAFLLAAALPAIGAPRGILPFDRASWKALAQAPAQPSIVVFSTTDCTHCPLAIEAIAQAMRKAPTSTRLAVVVMDGAGHEGELRTSRHYRQADSLYVFADDAMALRYAVNPEWRGLTPYVALIPAGGTPRFYAGAPAREVLAAFLRNPGRTQ